MSIGKPVGTVTRQRILVFRGGVFTVEPSLIPLFGVTVQLSMRKFNLFSFLNGDTTEFSIGSVCKLCMTVQVEEIPKQFNCGLFLKISLAKYLEIANIGHRVWSDVLRMELEASKHISEFF